MQLSKVDPRAKANVKKTEHFYKGVFNVSRAAVSPMTPIG